MGRAKINAEQMPARFPSGTFARIDQVRGEQNRNEFVREAVEKELRRRERIKPQKDIGM